MLFLRFSLLPSAASAVIEASLQSTDHFSWDSFSELDEIHHLIPLQWALHGRVSNKAGQEFSSSKTAGNCIERLFVFRTSREPWVVSIHSFKFGHKLIDECGVFSL